MISLSPVVDEEDDADSDDGSVTAGVDDEADNGT